jgi:2-(1,2-epoxy-1,2-dihydrophenyl)acetyl-CoA isomerase
LTDVASDLTVVIDGHVATIEIHRAPNNYLDVELARQVADALAALDREPDCRSVVLCSEGRHFCAGVDFGATGLGSSDRAARLYEQAVRLFETALPVVAAVQGAAVGGGLGLALAADFRIATRTTRFRCNFARLGYHHGFGISVTLPALVGQQRALELLYAGATVSGDEALRMGLCDRLVDNGELRAAAAELASEIATSGPLAVRAIRHTMRGRLAAQVRAALARELAQQNLLRGTADFREGVAATAERRPPNFTGT